MPCNSEYMHASEDEIEMSRVYQLLDELAGKPIRASSWDGYDPRVYGRGLPKNLRDKKVSELCRRLKAVDVTRYSLEMQLWWRDHQKADAARKQREKEEQAHQNRRKKALSKLSPDERRALDVPSEEEMGRDNR